MADGSLTRFRNTDDWQAACADRIAQGLAHTIPCARLASITDAAHCIVDGQSGGVAARIAAVMDAPNPDT